MKRIGIGGLVVAAIVLASLSAASVAAAAGGPEYLGCGKAAKVNKKFTGHYANKECSKVSGTNEGKYERGPAKFPIKTSAKFGLTTVYLYNPEHKLRIRSPVRKGRGDGDDQRRPRTDADAQLLGLHDSERIQKRRKSQFSGPCNSPGPESE